MRLVWRLPGFARMHSLQFCFSLLTFEFHSSNIFWELQQSFIFSRFPSCNSQRLLIQWIPFTFIWTQRHHKSIFADPSQGTQWEENAKFILLLWERKLVYLRDIFLWNLASLNRPLEQTKGFKFLLRNRTQQTDHKVIFRDE